MCVLCGGAVCNYGLCQPLIYGITGYVKYVLYALAGAIPACFFWLKSKLKRD